MALRPEEISGIIKSQIRNYEAKIEQSETGTVVLVGDGIAKAYGLDNCMANELLTFPGGEYGMALNLEEDVVSIVMLSDDSDIKEGDVVKRTGRVVSVPVGEGSTHWASRSTAKVPPAAPKRAPSNPRRPASSSARASACRCRPASRRSTA